MTLVISSFASAASIRGRVEVAGRTDQSGSFVWIDLATIARTDASGAYEIPGLANGTYIVKAWAPRCLAQYVDTVTVAGGNAEANELTLLAIDLYEDGRVNLQDYGAVMERYGSSSGDPDWDPDFDLTRDGVVDSLDARQLYAHWREAGDFAPPSFRIEVTSPDADAIWSLGRENVSIRWFTGHLEGNVSIELLLDGVPVETIASSTPNDGDYGDYDVPVSLAPGNGYSIRVSFDDRNRDESDRFGIHRFMTVLNPSAATKWYRGERNVVVQWEDGGIAGTVDITLWCRGNLIDTVVLDTPNDGLYDEYDVPADIYPADVAYQICVRVDDAQYGWSEFWMSWSGGYYISDPSSDTEWYTSQSVSIKWAPVSSLGSMLITLYRGDNLVDTIGAASAGVGTYRWSNVPATLEAGSDYQVCVRNQTSGAYGYSNDFTIVEGDTTIDVVEPTAATLWSPGQRNVPVRWLRNPLQGPVRIDLLRGAVAVRTISAQAFNDGELIWRVPGDLALASDYRVSVRFNDLHTDTSEAFTVGQRIVVEEPRDTTVWVAGSENVPIRWATGDLGGDVRIEIHACSEPWWTVWDTPNDGSYDDFDVPPYWPGGCYEMRISHESGAFDVSDEFTVREWLITVTEPAAGASWEPNHAVPPIRWSTEYPVESVSIALFKGEKLALWIAEATPNDGAFEGFIVPPSGLEGGSDYRVSVCTHNEPGMRCGSSEEFTVLPSVAVIEPTSTTIWERGAEAPPIRWETGGLGGTVSLTLCRGSVPLEVIAGATPNDGSFEGYVVPQRLSEGSDYRILVRFDMDRFDFSDSFLIK